MRKMSLHTGIKSRVVGTVPAGAVLHAEKYICPAPWERRAVFHFLQCAALQRGDGATAAAYGRKGAARLD